MPAHVRIYTTRTCPFCRAAERLLGEKDLELEEQDVTSDPDTRAWLAEVTGQQTVPQIFVNHEPIGGYRELSALEAKGELDALLAQDPVPRVAEISA